MTARSILNGSKAVSRKDRLWLSCVLAFLLALSSYRVRGLGSEPTADLIGNDDARILLEIQQHSETGANLEYLSDMIGPRLTGSDQLKHANQWTAEMFRKYGLTDAHLEPWTIAHSWNRGTAYARIVSPVVRPMTVLSGDWSPSTPGRVRGPVIYLDSANEENLRKFKGKLRGAIVITAEPCPLAPAQGKPAETPPVEQRPLLQTNSCASPAVAFLHGEVLKKEGVAAVLCD